jgi:hypothetical protein
MANFLPDSRFCKISRFRPYPGQSAEDKQGYGLLRIKKKNAKSNPYFLTYNEVHNFALREVGIRFSAEMDEFWSFVQTKGNQRWTWHASTSPLSASLYIRLALFPYAA